jgi:muramoyltetrapeptide carboxypeptidase
VGGFNDVKDNEIPFGATIEEIVRDAVGESDFPICFGFPTGHWPTNYPLMVGAKATLSVSHAKVELTMAIRLMERHVVANCRRLAFACLSRIE